MSDVQTYPCQSRFELTPIFSKYRANLESNVGRAVSDEGVQIKRQNVPLDSSDISECLGPITIGSNSQIALVSFDTVAPDLWVSNAQNCPDCAGHNTYDPTMSSSSHSVGDTAQIQYQGGTTISGPLFTDTGTLPSSLNTFDY